MINPVRGKSNSETDAALPMRKEWQPAAKKYTISSVFLLFSYDVNGAENLSSFSQFYCFV